MIRAALLIWLAMALGAAAQNPAAEQARAAAAELERASRLLDDAEGARDRVRALTQTILAFESGLGAMREGLRQAAISERRLTQRLAARDAEIAGLLGTLQTIAKGGTPAAFLHPQGPLGSARAGMLLAELTPAMNQSAAALRTDLENVQTLRALQSEAARRLQDGLTEVQAARTALNQAMANRTDLPRRFTEDPVRTAILIDSTETLDGFASGLANIASGGIAPGPDTMDAEQGALPLPVQGVLLRRAGEPDAAGIVRPGIILAARPGALVTTPTAATIRYAGPLLDFGNVVILEPKTETLFVLAGLDQVYGTPGEVIARGTPVGLMGGTLPNSQAATSTLREGSGTERSETLYIEVRQNNSPEDPANWFLLDEDR